MKSLIIYFLVLILMAACEEPVKFIEPQPQGKSNLSAFPDKFKGLYKSVNDDYTIEITDHLILRTYKSLVSITKNELDSSKNLELKGNMLIDNDNNIFFKVTINNDTISGFAIETDSVFNLSNENCLRKFNGHYFLNTKLDDGYLVQMLTNEGSGKISISAIKKEEMDNLKAITAAEEPNDSLMYNYKFELSKKEFKDFVNEMHGFRAVEVFQKVKDF